MIKIKILNKYGYNRILTNDDGLTPIEVNEADLAQIGKTKKFVFPAPQGDGAQCVIDMTSQEIAEKETARAAWQAKADKQAKIAAFKAQLAAMDYKTSKYADGDYTQAEWQAIVAERKAIRQQIGALETQN